ncbi:MULTISPECIES: hypothetical protein [Burkholderiaceae]|uniref:hypothetical protein n=1 Tax=Burkholderiaceae TaxID=119060 RepID=UPI0007863CCA|nr:MULTISPECIES: hypothetical protein [Burkholderiaceae]
MAFGFGHREAAQTLALYWENRWGCAASGDSLPNRAIAQMWYKRCGENSQNLLQISSPATSKIVTCDIFRLSIIRQARRRLTAIPLLGLIDAFPR